MKINFLLSLFLLLQIPMLFGQNAEISGYVANKDGEALVGVTIQIDETKQGTISDLNGNFTLTIDKIGRTLTASYIGFKTKKIQIKNVSKIRLILEDDTQQIDELVVIGYGQQKKIDLTSAIATIKPDVAQKMPGGITEALQGSVAGVNVSGGIVRIRGVGSINNTDPLWVVDGLIGGRIPNENEVESIQILKDAASCAIYGARGANGVIIVTTKRGKSGEAVIEYNGYVGAKWASKQLDLMNAQDFSLMVNESVWNYNQQSPTAPKNIPSAYANPYESKYDTDWQETWFRTGFYQSHNLNLSGGSKAATYRIGFNYGSNKGITSYNNWEGYSLFSNSELKKGWITVGENLTIDTYEGHDGGGNYSELLRSSPMNPIYDSSREDGFYQTGTGSDGNDLVNQIAERSMIDKKNNGLSVKSLTYLQIDLFKILKYRFNLGIDLHRSMNYEYKKAFDLGRVKNETDDLSESSFQSKRFLLEHTLTYDKTIGLHYFSIMGGITSEQSETRSIGGSGSSFSSGVWVLSGAQDIASKSIFGSAGKFAMYSQLGRLTYAYGGKYLVTANVRRDGSSKFVEKNRFGYFPSASIGWRVGEEAFLKGKATWLDNLKLRASYGLLGNQDIDSYAYESLIEIANQYYVFNDKLVPAPIPMTFGNPGLKWETTKQTDIGFDLDMLNNQLSFVFDYYNRETSDMLVKVAIPTSSGSANGVYMNAGSVRNQGVEFSTTWRDKIGELDYAIGGNISMVRNKVLKLGDNGEPIYAGFTEGVGNVTKTVEGSSIGRFYGYVTDGIFKTQHEIDNHTYTNPETGATQKIQPNAAPGDLKFLDLNNNGKLDDGDKEFIGSPIPTASYGISIDLSYKGFDFSIMGQGDWGNSIYNNGRAFLMHGTSMVNQMGLMNDRFRAENVSFNNGTVDIFLPKNTETDLPRAVFADPNGNFTRASDYFIENGSYFRIKRITLGYTFPERLLKKIQIKKLRMYIGAKNLFTFTKYTFYDPEVTGTTFEAGGANLNRGIDLQRPWSAVNPTAAEIFGGIQLMF